MAMGRVYACTGCARSISAWDEGNPYYRDARGRKRHAYHPSPDRERCTGIDTDMLCLGCGSEATSDSEAPTTACPRCASAELVDVWLLEGRACPFCRAGTFAEHGFMIS